MSDTKKVSISLKFDARQADKTITLERVFNDCNLQDLYNGERILSGKGGNAMSALITSVEQETLLSSEKVDVRDYAGLKVYI